MSHRDSKEVRAPRPSQTLGGRRTAMRLMRRQSVGMVAVYEQDPTAQEAGTRALVFEMIGGCKRVVEFPADWQRLSDDELSAIRRSAN